MAHKNIRLTLIGPISKFRRIEVQWALSHHLNLVVKMWHRNFDIIYYLNHLYLILNSSTANSNKRSAEIV